MKNNETKTGNAYMKRNQMHLFIEIAIADKEYYEYSYEKRNSGKHWNSEDDEYYQYLRGRYEAYQNVREDMELEDEYERFKLICLDSQMTFIENSGKYTESDINCYVRKPQDEYQIHRFYDSYVFGIHWDITNDKIFENGWNWTDLYEYSSPDKDFEHESCEQLNKLHQKTRERKRELAKSWLTKEEAEDDVTSWHCNECGTTFYAKYRSKYSQAPVCPVCGVHDWLWIY